MEDRLASKASNPRLLQNALIAFDASGLALTIDDLRHATPLDAVRAVDVGHGLQQALALLVRDAGEDAAVGGDRLEELDRFAESLRGHTVGHRRHRTNPFNHEGREGHEELTGSFS